MALINCDFESAVLGLKTSVRVIFPAENKNARDVPALYLLHGFTDDETVWCRYSSIERYCRRLNLTVVMPTVHRSFYQNTCDGRLYFDFVKDELPDMIERMLPVSGRREDRFAAGLSMGGYGAFKLGFSEPYKYSCVASLSGAVDIEKVAENSSVMPEADTVFGKEIKPEADLYYLANKAASLGKMPAVFQCCGTEDFLYKNNMGFSEFIKDICSDYTYEEGKGNHNWDFWDEYIKKVLVWIKAHNGNVSEF